MRDWLEVDDDDDDVDNDDDDVLERFTTSNYVLMLSKLFSVFTSGRSKLGHLSHMHTHTHPRTYPHPHTHTGA